MKPTIKALDISTGASTYSINESDKVNYYLLKGNITLTKNIGIIWGTGSEDAPADTVVWIVKTAIIAQTPSYKLSIFGQAISDEIATKCDLIVCVKLGAGLTNWKRIYLTSYDLKTNGGMTSTKVGDRTEIAIDLSGVIDNKTIILKDDKITAVIPTSETFTTIDDFIDATSKEVENSVLSSEAAGTIQIQATTALGGTGSVAGKNPIYKRGFIPKVEVFAKINTRGSSTIYIGFLDAVKSPTRGAYFKLSMASMEVFTVLNDGTERIVTSGVSAALSTYVKYGIQVNANGTTIFSINDVVVRTENSYNLPDEAYIDAVAVDSGTVDTHIVVDYMKMTMNRV